MNSQSPFVSVQGMVDFRAEGEKILREKYVSELLRSSIDMAVDWAGPEVAIKHLKAELVLLEAKYRWEGK